MDNGECNVWICMHKELPRSRAGMNITFAWSQPTPKPKRMQTTTAIADNNNEGLPFKTLHVWSSACALFQVTGHHGYPNRLNHGYPIRLKSLVTLCTVGLYVYIFWSRMLYTSTLYLFLIVIMLWPCTVHVCHTLWPCTVPVFDCHTLWPCICFWSSYGLTLCLFLIVIHFDLVSVSDCHMVWPCTCFWLSYGLTLYMFPIVILAIV